LKGSIRPERRTSTKRAVQNRDGLREGEQRPDEVIGPKVEFVVANVL